MIGWSAQRFLSSSLRNSEKEIIDDGVKELLRDRRWACELHGVRRRSQNKDGAKGNLPVVMLGQLDINNCLIIALAP